MRFHITHPQRLAGLLCGSLLASFLLSSLPAYAVKRTEHTPSLRVRIGDRVVLGEADLQRMTFRNDAAAQDTFRRNVIPIKPGQHIQLTVEMVNARGRATDVTNTGAAEYQSLAPWKLNVSLDGLVTVPGADELLQRHQAMSVGDTAIYISLGEGASSAWNKIFFRIEQ